MSQSFNELTEKRRTIYALGPTLPLPEDEVISIIRTAIRNAPSAFNSQS